MLVRQLQVQTDLNPLAKRKTKNLLRKIEEYEKEVAVEGTIELAKFQKRFLLQLSCDT